MIPIPLGIVPPHLHYGLHNIYLPNYVGRRSHASIMSQCYNYILVYKLPGTPAKQH